MSFTAQGRPNLISLKDPPQPKYSNESSPQRGQGLDEGLEQEKLPTGCVHPWTSGNVSVPQPQPGLLSEAAGDMSLVFCALPCTMIGPSVISTPSISPKVLHSPGPVEVWRGPRVQAGPSCAHLCPQAPPQPLRAVPGVISKPRVALPGATVTPWVCLGTFSAAVEPGCCSICRCGSLQ